jgi:NTP pyrophosphatase (non-canonical NTP hydrolase)|tara:strand:- start:51 stop:332 length:282 start_codon:yes stop_codon:yes gene_type:complete
MTWQTDILRVKGQPNLCKKQEALIILMEECGEVIQEASKILRFGNDTHNLTKELGDLQCMINQTANHLEIDSVQIGIHANEKRDKLKKYSNLL